MLGRYAPCPNGNGHIITKEASLKIDPFINAEAVIAEEFQDDRAQGVSVATLFGTEEGSLKLQAYSFIYGRWSVRRLPLEAIHKVSGHFFT